MPALLAALLLLVACSASTSPSPTAAAPSSTTAQTPTMSLIDFTSDDLSAWHIQNDGVMGGRSEGHMKVAGGALAFTGEVITEGGGFTSVLLERNFDLSAFTGVEARVRGGGRTFEFAIDDGVRSRGREVWRRVPFTPTEEWSWVKLPFADLDASVHGEPYDAPALDRAAVEKVGFYIMDGRDGAFRLEVSELRGY